MEMNDDPKPRSSSIDQAMDELLRLQESLVDQSELVEHPFSQRSPSNVDELESAILNETQTNTSLDRSNPVNFLVSNPESSTNFCSTVTITKDHLLTSTAKVSHHGNKSSDIIPDAQYVLVEEPVNLNDFYDFHDLHSGPCHSDVNIASDKSKANDSENKQIVEHKNELSALEIIADEVDNVIDTKEEKDECAKTCSMDVEAEEQMQFDKPNDISIEGVPDKPEERSGSSNDKVIKEKAKENNSNINDSTGQSQENNFENSEIENSSNEEKLMEKLKQEKNTFSENLGLMPSDLKGIFQRSLPTPKGVRTRKRSSKAVKSNKAQRNSIEIVASNFEHKHCTDDFFHCGGCGKKFTVMCQLHDHLQAYCSTGSYHYDHVLKTAFPKFDTACSSTQTAGLSEDVSKTEECIPKKLVVKFRAPKPLRKSKVSRELLPEKPKRKRGRPKKVKPDESEEFVQVKVESLDGSQNDVVATDYDDQMMEFDDNIDDLFDNIPETVHPKPEDIDDRTHNKVLQMEDTENIVDDLIDNSRDNEILDTKDAEFSVDKIHKRSQRKRKSTKPRRIMMTTDQKTAKDLKMGKISVSNTIISCDLCGDVFSTSQSLLKHERQKHEDQLNYECDECDLKFVKESSLDRHKTLTHRDDSKVANGADGVKKKRGRKKQGRKLLEICEICNTMVPGSKLDVHVRLHTGERPFTCEVCGKGLISERKLKRHLALHDEPTKHTCEVCGRGFAMRHKLRMHMFTHTGHKPYLCSVCGAEFNNSTSLLHHHRTVHLGDKRFECKVCGGRYGKKSQLEEHMFSHSNERTQTCRYCGKSFKHAKSLRRHEQTHITDSKFACDLCDSKFSRKDNLDRHRMCHVETAYQCSFCRKKFKERQPLIEHEQYHINSKKFMCQVCKEKFLDETYFYNHMETNHGVSKEMVPTINAIAGSNASDKTPKKKSLTKNEKLVSVGEGTDDLDFSTTSTSRMDTLNLSMSVAGIIPTSGSANDITHLNQSTTSALSLNQSFLSNSSDLDPPLRIPGLTTVANIPYQSGMGPSILQGVVEPQRLGPMPQGDQRPVQGPTDGMISVALNADGTLLLQEHHRLVQEALGSSIQSLQGQQYRLQNMY